MLLIIPFSQYIKINVWIKLIVQNDEVKSLKHKGLKVYLDLF